MHFSEIIKLPFGKECHTLLCILKLFTNIVHYYIDIDEIPGFLLLLKNHIFTARSERIIFIFHM